jgi:hypothetical protein
MVLTRDLCLMPTEWDGKAHSWSAFQQEILTFLIQKKLAHVIDRDQAALNVKQFGGAHDEDTKVYGMLLGLLKPTMRQTVRQQGAAFKRPVTILSPNPVIQNPPLPPIQTTIHVDSGNTLWQFLKNHAMQTRDGELVQVQTRLTNIPWPTDKSLIARVDSLKKYIDEWYDRLQAFAGHERVMTQEQIVVVIVRAIPQSEKSFYSQKIALGACKDLITLFATFNNLIKFYQDDNQEIDSPHKGTFGAFEEQGYAEQAEYGYSEPQYSEQQYTQQQYDEYDDPATMYASYQSATRTGRVVPYIGRGRGGYRGRGGRNGRNGRGDSWRGRGRSSGHHQSVGKSSNWSQGPPRGGSGMICQLCETPGHTARRCYKIAKYVDGAQPNAHANAVTYEDEQSIHEQPPQQLLQPPQLPLSHTQAIEEATFTVTTDGVEQRVVDYATLQNLNVI